MFPFKRLLSFGVMLFMLTSMAFPSIVMSSSAQTQACTPSNTLHMTLFGGAPYSFNTLQAYNPSGFFAESLAFLNGGAPQASPTGQPLNFSTAAQSFSSNSNYTQWTIQIKPGLKWSNGQPVTPQDYINDWSPNFALNASVDPINLHTEVVSVVAVNSTAVRFNLNQSDAHLPDKIDQVFDTELYPSSFTTQGAGFNGFGTQPGLGPFYIANYTSGQTQLVLNRNPNYSPLPSVCQVQVNFVESEASDATYVAAGSSDVAPIVPQSISSLAKLPNVHILYQPFTEVETLGFNVTWYPYNMTQFRQALIYGINESQLVQVAYDGYAIPAYNAQGGVVPNSTWYNPNQMKYSFDPSKALSLLSSIGIKKGADGYLQYPNGTDVSLALFADSDIPMNSISAQFVQSDLQALGMKINLQLTSTSNLIGDLYSNSGGAENGGMTLHISPGYTAGDPYLLSLPWIPAGFTLPGPFDGTFENPPSVQAEYQSNSTAITNTDNPTLERTYLNNIQAINAQYLPADMLMFGGDIFAYSTAHFTGWPSGYLQFPGLWNYTALATLTPVTPTGSATSSTTHSSTSSSAQGSSSLTSTSATATSVSSSASSTSTSSSGGLSSSLLLAVAAIVIIVVVVGVVYAVRRQPKNT